MLSVRLILILGTILTLFASFSIGFIVLLSGHNRNARKVLFCLFSCMIGIWATAFQVVPLYIHDNQSLEISVRVSQTLASIVALLFSLFSATFISLKRYRTYSIIGAVTAFFIAQFFIITLPLIAGIIPDVLTNSNTYEFNTVSIPIIILFDFFAAGLPVMLGYLKHTKPKYEDDLKLRRQFLISTILILLGLLIFTYAIPLYLGSSIVVEYAFFNIIVIIFLFVSGRYILRNGAVDVKRRVWRIILKFILRYVICLLALTISELFLSLYETGSNLLVIRVVFYPLLIAAAWYIGAELTMLLLTRYEINLQNLNQELQKLRGVLDLSVLRKRFSSILLNELHPKEVLIISIKDEDLLENNEVFCVTKSSGVKEPSAKTVRSIAYMLSETVEPNFITQYSEIELKSQAVDGYAMGILYRTESESGAVLISTKTDKEDYDSVDEAMFNSSVAEYSLLAQSARQYTQIKQFNAGLQHQIDEATKELRESNQKLIGFDEAKDEFIMMASHQLRTPLTSIKGYVSMVLEGDAGDVKSQQRKLLDQAFASSQRMVYLISDLLNLSRIRNGKFILAKKSIDLSLIVENEIAQQKSFLDSRNIKLEFDKPADFPVFFADESKIRQVCMNFINNAVHYTPQGGVIKVLLSAQHDLVNLKVIDNGIGVPANAIPHIFTKFYRASNAQKLRPDGTGIGLYMVKKIIEAHAGKIIFESKEDKGSTFGFSLPMNSHK